MTLSIVEKSDEVTGLKSKEFISKLVSLKAKENPDQWFWIVPVRTNTGGVAGYFCWFVDEDGGHEYHLKNNKGIVRSFKTVEAAMNFYKAIRLAHGGCLLSVTVALV